ncbi:hypothetical protein [Phycisphaera mikurensis]|nr:hypothetical protein [Phycisphaera mikurensis]MBB6442004.1 hypothetical protein [Phycisphaera mikurensis]
MPSTLLLAGGGLLALTSTLLAAGAASAAPMSGVTVGFGEAVPVNRGAFGLNNNNAAADARTNGDAYPALIKALGATSSRYLGGSSSSFWDWRTGKYIPADEITAIWPEHHGNWMLPLVADVARLPDGTLGPDNYAAFAEKAGVDVQWMTNFTTREDDQADMVRHLHDEGIPVKYLELDNETYFWGAEFGGGEDRSRKYIERVKDFTPLLRELYPDARVGVVASENGVFADEMHEKEDAHTLWNGVITRPAYRDLYDAFILHHYVMNQGTLDGVADGNVSDATLGPAFLTCPEVTLGHAIDVLAEEHGGIPMWITEFNVIGYYRIGNPDDEKPDTGVTDADAWIARTAHTPWNAIYQAGFWLMALQHPEAIEILNHHSVTNVDLGWGLGLPVSTEEADLTATGQLFAHLSHLAVGADGVMPLTFEGNPDLGSAFGGEEAGALQGVAVERDGKKHLIVINRGADPVSIAMPGGGAAERISYRTDRENPRTSRVKLAGETPVWRQGPMEPETVAVGAGGRVELPAFSLSVLMSGR